MTFKMQFVEIPPFFEKMEQGGDYKFRILCKTYSLGEHLSIYYDGTLTRSYKKIQINVDETPQCPYYLAKVDGSGSIIFERVVK